MPRASPLQDFNKFALSPVKRWRGRTSLDQFIKLSDQPIMVYRFRGQRGPKLQLIPNPSSCLNSKRYRTCRNSKRYFWQEFVHPVTCNICNPMQHPKYKEVCAGRLRIPLRILTPFACTNANRLTAFYKHENTCIMQQLHLIKKNNPLKKWIRSQ